MIKVIVFSIILALCLCQLNKPKSFPRYPISLGQDQLLSLSSQLSYETLNFSQKVSHYNFKYESLRFNQKYLIDSTYFNKTNGTILMYCGNQGPIEMFYKNTGFYNDIVSKQLNGLIVYPQHRYFGTSMPFGDEKTSYQKENLILLTTEQALMDFVQFIKFIKNKYCQNCPVIAFGGSYGGMLASWIRMKYPFIVDFAHAASAPIYYYKNRKNLDLGIFFQIVTKNYQMHNTNCANVIRQGFNRLVKYSKNTSAPIYDITNYFNLCKPLKSYTDIQLLIQYINDGYSYMAMLNYPYPTSFLKNLTSWPANTSCLPLDNINTKSNDKQLFSAIRQSVQYYYSFNKKQCNQIYQDSATDQDMSGWNILACGDQAMPMTMNGVKDMFYPEGFDYNQYSKYCYDQYGIKPDYEYTLNHFGGVTDQEYLDSTHIIFTNGGLDPWSGASPTKTLSDTLISCFIPNGAHHLDLRPPNPADPSDVVNCRNVVISTLKKWIAQRNAKRNINKQQKQLRSE